MSQNKIIFGNWKMQLTLDESVALAHELKTFSPFPHLTVGVFPSFDALASVHAVLKGSDIILGAQDCYWEEKGAFTGEESVAELVAVGCTHVLVGHSERRTRLGETDEMVNKKLHAALAGGLTPVLCIGETDAERAQREVVVKRQVERALQEVVLAGSEQIIIAYEPVWAIGTGNACAPGTAQEVHAFMRSVLTEQFGSDASARFHIIYGGSVEPETILSYLKEEGIDGALVGGASVRARELHALLTAASQVMSPVEP